MTTCRIAPTSARGCTHCSKPSTNRASSKHSGIIPFGLNPQRVKMGLPRYLQSLIDNKMPQELRDDLLLIGFNAGARASTRTAEALAKAAERGASQRALARSIVKGLCRKKYRPSIQAVDQLSRIDAKLYVGLEHRDSEDKPVFITVNVPRCFQARLELVNSEREQRDRDALDLRDKIIAFRKRVYSSRTFPPALRAIIFERDNYTCQVCLRNRASLLAIGLHLECDHIQEWEDGGQTALDNGQTLCDECNKAKHHAKKYLGMIAHLRSTRRL